MSPDMAIQTLAAMALVKGFKPSFEPPVEHITLANGAQLMLMADRCVPLVHLQLISPGGARREPTARAGIASLVPPLLLTGGAQPEALGQALDDLAAEVHQGCAWDAAHLGLSVMSGDQLPALDWLLGLWRRPLKPQRRNRKMRQPRTTRDCCGF